MMALMYLPLGLDGRCVAPVLLIAATVVQVWAGATFYRAAWRAARHGSTNMNTLVAVGTSVAYGYSAFVTLWPSLAATWGFPGHLYYETAVIIVALILLGRWLEARAKSQTGAAVSALMGLQAPAARVIRDGVELDVPIEQVHGRRPGARAPRREVPVDGVVDRGPLRRRREHADRREPAGRQGARRRGHRRHPQHDRQLRVHRAAGSGPIRPWPRSSAW